MATDTPTCAWRRLLLLALALLAACQGDDTAEAREAEQQHQHLVLLKSQAAQAAHQVVLLGSSTFARWPADQGPPALNLGVAGDTVPGLVRRMKDYSALAEARVLVVNIGLNDLRSHCAADRVDLAPLLLALPATVPVVWVGIQGLSPALRERWCDGRFAALSVTLNERVRQACAARESCSFMPHPVPEDVDGRTSASLHVADGVHLSASGYAALAARLQATLATLPSPPASTGRS